AQTYQFAYQELEQIYLYPSTFAAPHLLLGIDDARICVVIAVEVPGSTQKATVPNDFITKMKVFSDPTRAAILKSLLQHPYCIQQLAELHGISEPAVAKHMKLLSEADFVWGE
ncbi:winged helix-turn-helix domain-containing protein, partial [Frankia sp. Cpl3]|nr:winged helix-turn-helix domain-containing protein [Frankia sp. Cpl3]